MTSSNLNKKTEFFAVKVQLRSMPYIFGLAYGCVLTCNKYDMDFDHCQPGMWLFSPKDFLNYNIATYKGGPLGNEGAYYLLDSAKEWADANPHLLPELERRCQVLNNVSLSTQQ